MDEELEKIIQDIEVKSQIALHRSIQDGDPKHHKEMISEGKKEIMALIASYSKGVERRAYTDALYDSGYTPDYINAPISTKAVEKRLKAFKALGGKPEGKPNE